MLQPYDMCPKTGQPVLDVLCSKHPEALPLSEKILDTYEGKPPEMVPVYITDLTVATLARQILGLLGPGGVDFISLQQWLMNFGVASLGLRYIVGEFGYWMANGRPPWVAYSALMAGRLISLYKCPWVRPVGVGEIWWRMLVKFVLVVMGAEAKEAFVTEQL